MKAKMDEFLKGCLDKGAYASLKGAKLSKEDLFKFSKGLGYEDDEDDDDDDVNVHVDVNSHDEDDDEMEKGARVLDELAERLAEARGDDLFDTLAKSLRESEPFQGVLDGFDDGLRKGGFGDDGLVKSLLTGTQSAFKVATSAIDALGEKVEGNAELTMLSAEAAVNMGAAVSDLRAEIDDLRKSLGMPAPVGKLTTAAARFPSEGASAPASAKADGDPKALHGRAMERLAKSMREANAANDQAKARKLGSLGARIASVSDVMKHPRGQEILAGIADGDLISKLVG